MTKTLTEQWKNGELEFGYYYIDFGIGGVPMLFNGLEFYCERTQKPNAIKTILEPVPSYDEHNELKQDNKYLKSGIETRDKQIEQLEKKLEIATKALKEYADSSNWYETDDFGISAIDQFACDDYGYNIAKEALEEMEGVK